MRSEWLLGAMVGLLLSGCPEDSGSETKDAGEDSGAGGADGGAKDAGTSTDPSAKVGTFTIRLVAPKAASGGSSASDGFTSIGGKVFDAPVPEEVVWDVDTESGGCKLLKPRVPFCDPACDQAVCVEDDMCEPNAKAKGVGVVTVSGLKRTSGSGDVSIEPIAYSYSTPGDVMLPYPAFEEGGAIKLHAAGDNSAAFDIEAKGIAPLEITTESFPLKASAALAVAWKAAGKSDVSRIQVKLDISHHGGTKGKIECDVPDNGSLNIASSLVGKLLNLGVAGYPTIVVGRVSTGTVKTSGGTVELKVIAEVEHSVTVDGVSSCTDNADCGSGKTCQSNLTCSK